MRTISEIEAEIKIQSATLNELDVELNIAQVTAFIKESNIPDGVRPIFIHNQTGERVLVSGFSGYWPTGFVFKKDGTLSNRVQRFISSNEYTFVGE